MSSYPDAINSDCGVLALTGTLRLSLVRADQVRDEDDVTWLFRSAGKAVMSLTISARFGRGIDAGQEKPSYHLALPRGRAPKCLKQPKPG
jgi:hypothetical protein